MYSVWKEGKTWKNFEDWSPAICRIQDTVERIYKNSGIQCMYDQLFQSLKDTV